MVKTKISNDGINSKNKKNGNKQTGKEIILK
jgi:hypothetical protein